MEKYLLAAVLVMVSASAMADRMVSGSSHITYENKAEACQDAKRVADRQRNNEEQIESFSICDCYLNNQGQWTCSVDAKVEKKH